MTKLTGKNPVTRETAANHRGRPLVIELHAKHISIRPKGTRQATSVSYEAVYDLGWKIFAREAAAQRKALRGQRRFK